MFPMMISKMTFKIEDFYQKWCYFFFKLKKKQPLLCKGKGSQMKSEKTGINSVCSHFCNIIKYVTTNEGAKHVFMN